MYVTLVRKAATPAHLAGGGPVDLSPYVPEILMLGVRLAGSGVTAIGAGRSVAEQGNYGQAASRISRILKIAMNVTKQTLMIFAMMIAMSRCRMP